MTAVKLSAARDVVAPLFMLIVFLFMPYRIVQALILFFLFVRILALLVSVRESGRVVVSRIDRAVYADAGHTFRVRYLVRVSTPFPTGSFLLSDGAGELAPSRLPTDLLTLKPGEEREIEYRAVGNRRGEYELGPFAVSGSDPVGLYPWTVQRAAMLPAIIYPPVRRVSLRSLRGLPSGSLVVKNRLYEDLTQFQSIREYMPGDELKRVNWKISARMGALYSMEYVPTVYFPVLIALNLSWRDYPVQERWTIVERAIETAASLIFYYVGIKQSVGMVTTGVVATGVVATGSGPDGSGAEDSETDASVPVGVGYGNAIDMLKRLARIRPSKEGLDLGRRLAQTPLPTGVRLVVITPPPSKELSDRLVALRRRGCRPEVFVVGARTASRDSLSIAGLESRAVVGRDHELVYQ